VQLGQGACRGCAWDVEHHVLCNSLAHFASSRRHWRRADR
jgi:hypothetical protein